MKNLKKEDIKIFNIIAKELARQEEGINLIASENYASKAVLEATASVLTNKYCEGYPSKRYYAGCEHCDEAEILAIERCKKLFDAEHVNVQAHAGSQANMGVYFAILNLQDTVLGMSLSSGGHLTHGHPINFSGKFYNFVQYGVNKETEQIDYDEVEQLAKQHKPKLIIAGASAYSKTIDFERFSKIAKSVGAYLLVDMAHIAGLVAAKVHPSPVPYADFITSTTHKTLRGPRGAIILCKKEFADKIDKAIMPGIQGGPFMNIIAAKAVAFEEALRESFVDYQKQVIKNAQAMTNKFIELGYQIVSGGTDNHLFILNLTNKGITGKDAEKILEQNKIYVSRSTIPFDTQKPYITSGIRIGTPAITTRGLKENDCEETVLIIDEIFKNPTNSYSDQIETICKRHPIYE